MTPEQQRIKIAEVCGWTECEFVQSLGICKGKHNEVIPAYESGHAVIPDYLNDLNAMHEAEKVLLKGYEDEPDGCDLWADYQTTLILACPAYLSYHATAAQRAEAFLRTLNLWDESK